MINRAIILLKYKAPAVHWINDADPYNDDPGITAASVNEDRTGYLISEEDADGPLRVERWIKSNFRTLFESELEGWYTDPELWPKKRTLKLFKSWFDVECHTVLIDTVGDGIYDDDL